MEAGATAVRFEYAETSRLGAVLDRERGWVPGLALRGELEAGRLFVTAAGWRADGTVAYAGRTQSTNPALDGLPLTTDSGATFAGLEARGGGWLDPRRRVGAWIGAAARAWDRDIRPSTAVTRTGATIPVSGLREEYRWKELQLGARAVALALPSLRLELEAQAFALLLPRMTVEWLGDRVELDLGTRLGARVGATARWTPRARWYAVVEASWEQYRFGESALDPDSGLVEPESRTTALAAAVRLGWHL